MNPPTENSPAIQSNRAGSCRLQIRDDLQSAYADVYTPQALNALAALADFNGQQKELMVARIERRMRRFREQEPIGFLDAGTFIPRTKIKVQDAREGNFTGSEIPTDLQRQWIQGTGPAAKPNAPIESSIRNVAYALLSGADGWMFDGEDALGQIKSMSLDNQRNLKLAIRPGSGFHGCRPPGGPRDEPLGARVLRPPKSSKTGKPNSSFTTKIFRARGLHLDDRHVRDQAGRSFSASIVDLVLYVVNNYQRLIGDGSSIVLYLPKIQTAEEAALWNEMLAALEDAPRA